MRSQEELEAIVENRILEIANSIMDWGYWDGDETITEKEFEFLSDTKMNIEVEVTLRG